MTIQGLLLALLGGALAACVAHGRAAPVAAQDSALAPGARWIDAETIEGERSFLAGWEPKTRDGWVRAVVEIPSGHLDKFEVKPDGRMHWDIEDGKPRTVRYLGYPANYGMVPRTVLAQARGGDGDPLDILVLGAALPRASVVEVKVIGLILLVDRGERDDKLLAVAKGTPFEKIDSIEALDREFPGVTQILQTWFLNYKGPGKFTAQGFSERDQAMAALDEAAADYVAAHPPR